MESDPHDSPTPEPDEPTSPKHWRLVWALVAVCLIGTPVGIRLAGINLLTANLANLKQQGEELDLDKLIVPFPAASNNAYLSLSSLSNRLAAASDTLRNSPRTPEVNTNGTTASIFTLTEWTSRRYDSAADKSVETTNTWESYVSILTPYTNLLDTVVSTLKLPDYRSESPPKSSIGQIIPLMGTRTMRTSKEIEHLLKAGFLFHASQGRRAKALECVNGLLDLMRGLRNERLLIVEMIRQTIVNTAFQLSWEAVQMNEITDLELSRLAKHWGDLRFSEDMLEAFRMERAMTLQQFELLGGKRGSQARRQREWEQAWESGDMGWGPEPTTLNRFLIVPMWYVLWQEQDCSRALDIWNSLVDLQANCIRSGWLDLKGTKPTTRELLPFAVLSHLDEELTWNERYRFVFSASLSVMDNANMVARAVKNDALARVMETGIALRRYQLKHGAMPPDLDALVPEFLDSVPLDPIDLKPLRYHLNPEGWKLYSIGVNGLDEGGDWNADPSVGGFGPSPVIDSLDIYWPQPERTQSPPL
jgi:hypothetical protein